MVSSKGNMLTKQRRIPIIGEFRQLVGGAITWLSFATFLFAGFAAWDSNVMLTFRAAFPWLNFYMACGLLLVFGVLAVWLEHKFAQPSIMVYWLRMFWEQRNPMRTFLENKLATLEQRQSRIEKLLKELLEQEKHG